MNITLRDISKKNRNYTLVLIRKKSVDDEEHFLKSINKFNKFIWIQTNRLNYKYFTKSNVVESEVLINEFIKYYRNTQERKN